MKKVLLIILLCLIITPAFGQLKPMLGRQVDISHHLSDFVGFWPMWEGSGNKVFDLSGNGNIGTITTRTWVAAKFGSGLEGTVGGILISTSSSIEISGDQSYIIWVKFSALDSDDQRLFCKRDIGGTQIDFFTDGTNLLGFYDGVNVRKTGAILTTGIWYQIAFVVKNNVLTIYLDGKIKAVDNSSVSVTSDDADLYIGRYYTDVAQIRGIIDHALYYNRALSASEIAELYWDSFCMFTKDNVALMITEVAPPFVVPTLYYYSKLAPLSLILFAVYCYWFGKERKCVA